METKEIISPVKEYLIRFNDYYQDTIKSDITIINEINSYLSQRKGKQIRPAISFLVAQISGCINENTIKAATVMELLHNAALVHDDILDDSDYRRGLETVHSKWDIPTAILYADYLLALSFNLASKIKIKKINQIVSRAFKLMCEAEFLQKIKVRDIHTKEDDYFRIIYGKTASLIEATTESAAITATNDKNIINKFKKFGKYLGLLYQIQDDIIDYTSNKSVSGKSQYNDIKEKKITLPLIHSFSKIGRDNHIADMMKNGRLSDEEITQVAETVLKTGGIDYSFKYALQYHSKAIDILSKFPDSLAKSSLNKLVNYLLNRNQ